MDMLLLHIWLDLCRNPGVGLREFNAFNPAWNPISLRDGWWSIPTKGLFMNSSQVMPFDTPLVPLMDDADLRRIE